jgi:hypothetical protein
MITIGRSDVNGLIFCGDVRDASNLSLHDRNCIDLPDAKAFLATLRSQMKLPHPDRIIAAMALIGLPTLLILDWI